ncbi:MAG: glycosyltransferase, partial [Candidatus Pacebacteria bacterium]|nr:glycosyltransferase [Candidatus Paceibacterota bacterium]
GPRGFAQATTALVAWQRLFLIILAGTVVGLLILDYYLTILALNIFVTIVYLVSSAYRAFLIDVSLRQDRDISINRADLIPPGTDGWPRYLVLVPLYHEDDILPHLVQSLSELDYPDSRLEIRLLIEEDDDKTMAAARQLNPARPFVIFPVPVSQPRTKPKACNIGLRDTDADYLVIYDAEDRPDPDQLKKAVVAFSRVPKNVACIQAKLNFYNSHHNFLTRCFTAEYATWFDLCLPGLDFLKAPIPLGGTSNHFRLDILINLGGWDEYNVTEDCDLGLRLFYNGWRTRILNSTTWEQACPNLRYWIKQRSRWVKGYVQTYLVHLRSPGKLIGGLGIMNGAHFHLLIGGTPFCQLLNPIYWCLTLFWIVSQNSAFSAYFPGPVFVMAAICLFVGNFFFAYTSSIACVQRGFGNLAKYGLLMPIYWVLMSIAAWKGCLQLLWNPHYWEKTKHFGISKQHDTM